MMNRDQKHGGGGGGSANLNHPINVQQQPSPHNVVDKDNVVDESIADFGRAGDSMIEHEEQDDDDECISHRDGDRINCPDEDDHNEDDDDDEEYSGETYSFFPYPIGDVTCWRSVGSFRDCCCRLNSAWIRHNQTQIVSGVTLALAQIPEAVSFSLVVGVNPVLGLQSAWIMGLVTSLTGGRPGMVAGATGAVSVVLTNLVAEFGIGHLFYCLMLAGLLQVLFGVFRLGEAIRLIPHPVMVGFCNGLGLVIGFAQINNFRVPSTYPGYFSHESVDDSENSDGDDNDSGSLAGVFRLFGPLDPLTNNRPWAEITMIFWMLFHTGTTIITYALLPRISTTIPASVAAVMISTVLEYVLVRPLGYETYTINDFAPIQHNRALLPIWVKSNDSGGYDTSLPAVDTKLLGEIFLTASFTAFIGLFESLLTMQIIDELTESKGSANREARGQGLGQICCGIFGGMGGCTTIGQSLMNMHSGGYTRLSSSVAGVVLLLITVAAYPLINLVPVASLAGVMFLVSFFTIEWDSLWVVIGSLMPQVLRIRLGFHSKVKRSDVVIMVMVVAITLILDLAIAVIAGCLCACLVFAWDAGTRLTVRRHFSNNKGDLAEYSVRGPLYFGSVKPLMEALFPLDDDDDESPKPKRASIDLRETEIYDWSGIMAIKTVHDRFESNGTSVTFMNLSISSQSLMAKSKRLWEDVCILVDESDTESSGSEHHHGREEGTTIAGDSNNNDDTEVGTNTISSSTALPPPIPPPMSSIVKGRTTTTWGGVSALETDDVETVDGEVGVAPSGGGAKGTTGLHTTTAAAVATTTPGEQS